MFRSSRYKPVVTFWPWDKYIDIYSHLQAIAILILTARIERSTTVLCFLPQSSSRSDIRNDSDSIILLE